MLTKKYHVNTTIFLFLIFWYEMLAVISCMERQKTGVGQEGSGGKKGREMKCKCELAVYSMTDVCVIQENKTW